MGEGGNRGCTFVRAGAGEAGRPCKERMLEHVGEQRVPGTSRRWAAFEAKELKAEPVRAGRARLLLALLRLT